MDDLKQQREETERARTSSGVARDESGEGEGGKERPMLSLTQQANKRKLDERRALIEAKRQKVSRGCLTVPWRPICVRADSVGSHRCWEAKKRWTRGRSKRKIGRWTLC